MDLGVGGSSPLAHPCGEPLSANDSGSFRLTAKRFPSRVASAIIGHRSSVVLSADAPESLDLSTVEANLGANAGANFLRPSGGNIGEKFVDVTAMNPAAAAYVRQQPCLASQSMKKWRCGYLPNDDGGGDKRGWSLRVGLDNLGVPTVGVMSNRMTEMQGDKLATWAKQLGNCRVTLMFDCEPSGIDGAKEALWFLPSVCSTSVSTGPPWMHGGKFVGRQPENLTAGDWGENLGSLTCLFSGIWGGYRGYVEINRWYSFQGFMVTVYSKGWKNIQFTNGEKERIWRPKANAP